MNIAFGTLLILFLLSPGFVVRYTFLKGPYSRKNYKPSISDEIFWSIIPAVLLQLAGIQVLTWLGHNLSIPNLYYLIIGSDRPDINFDLIASSLYPFTWYSIILISVSGLLGYAARFWITRFKLDKRFNIFKINNEWFYLFSGRILDNFDDIEFIQTDVLVRSDNENIIYCGILQDFFLTSEGGIDRIYLANVYRRSFARDATHANAGPKKEDDRYYNMPGDYFVVFGREILNINITFYKLSES